MPRVVKQVAQNVLLYVTFGSWCFVWLFVLGFFKLNSSIKLFSCLLRYSWLVAGVSESQWKCSMWYRALSMW